jgi:preprotein translocase subunit SecG
VNIRGREVKIDKAVFAKAVAIMCLGWLALPIVYYMLKKRKDGKEEEEEIPKEEGKKTG